MTEGSDSVRAFERFKELERAVHECEGWGLNADLRRLSRSYRVFMGNDDELIGFLEEYEEVPAMLELWDVRNRGAFEEFLDEVDRLFHNYLASAASLRDHTRRIRRRYADDAGFGRDYDSARVKILGVPVCDFVQDLRNYTLHWRLPVARGKMSWGIGRDLESAVNLIKADLLLWDGWKAGGKRYVANAPDEIALKGVVREYTEAVSRFYAWFERAFVQEHRDNFQDLQARQTAAADAWRDATGDDPRPAH